jgi:hypothetical protein
MSLGVAGGSWKKNVAISSARPPLRMFGTNLYHYPSHKGTYYAGWRGNICIWAWLHEGSLQWTAGIQTVDGALSIETQVGSSSSAAVYRNLRGTIQNLILDVNKLFERKKKDK